MFYRFYYRYSEKFKISKLSRIIINLSLIYSKRFDEKGKIYILKIILIPATLKLHLPSIEEYEQNFTYHILYYRSDL